MSPEPQYPDSKPFHEADGTSATSTLTFFLRNRRWFFLAFFSVAALVVLVGYPWKLTYTSVGSFVTEAQRGGTVSNLAAQLGVVVGAQQSTTTSPMFYPELLKAQQFMGSVVEAQYPDRGSNGARRSLIDIWGVRSPDPRMSRELASRILNESMFIAVAPQTGIVKVAVTSDRPELAHEITRTILEKVQEFNIRTRQGRAAAERQFVERRLVEVRAELRTAEDRLQGFLQQNRDFSKSPTLQFQRVRLEQDVLMERQIMTAMAQAYEQAKIDEVRDTPVVTILSQPELPVLPNPRGRIRLLIIAIFAGLGAGLLALYALSLFTHQSTSSEPQRAELARLAEEIKLDLRRGRVLQVMFGHTENGTDGNGGGAPAATRERAPHD